MFVLYSHYAMYRPLFIQDWGEEVEITSPLNTWGPSDCLWIVPGGP